MKAVLPVVYIYVYLILYVDKEQFTYIPAGVSCFFILIRTGIPEPTVREWQVGSHSLCVGINNKRLNDEDIFYTCSCFDLGVDIIHQVLLCYI